MTVEQNIYLNEGTLNREKYLKCVFRLFNKNCVNKEGLDLSKEVLWVSVGPRVAEIPATRV